MEKDWIVECWGELGQTEIFYTEKEAREYFKSLRKGLDMSRFNITKDSIIDKNNPDNAVYITNLRKL